MWSCNILTFFPAVFFQSLSHCEEVACSASFSPLQGVFSEMWTAFHKHFLSCHVQALYRYNEWHIRFLQPGLAWKNYFKECTLFRGWQNRWQKKYERRLQTAFSSCPYQRIWTCSFHWKYCWLAFSYFSQRPPDLCFCWQTSPEIHCNTVLTDTRFS